MFKEEFENLGQIGEGSFAQVFRVRWRRDGKVYALKKARHQFRGVNDRRRAVQEVDALSHLQNEHVVRYLRAWEEMGYLFIQMELCEQGSLQSFMREHGVAPEQQIWDILVDLSQVVRVESRLSSSFPHAAWSLYRAYDTFMSKACSISTSNQATFSCRTEHTRSETLVSP